MRDFRIILLLTVLVLSACAAPPQPAPTITPTLPALPPTSPPARTASQCQQVAAPPTPDAEAPSLFAKPGEGMYDHLLGPDLAPATIIVYSDFACPTCAALSEILERLVEEHPTDLRLVYRHFPILTAYPNAGMAVRAAEAAHLQGRFWQMHDALFENQAEWTELADPALGEYLVGLAGKIGLEPGQFESDLESPVIGDVPEKAFDLGLEIGLPGTPLLLINGQIYTGPVNFGSLKFIVGMIALGERQFSTCPEMVLEPGVRYYATLQTEKGDVVLRLYADKAPLTVNSFIFLARSSWYEQITFHRVIPGFVAQTGDPSGTGAGNPGYFIVNETEASLKFDRAGLLGMANSGPDTNGSQFFITLGPAPHLDGNYTVFGEVVSGLDVLEQLTPRDPLPGQDAPAGDRLISVSIEER
ncbi:MAG: peptidylprolyl isomerase [Anaerolineae bacterium]|nr:peptidylprolyl isomerase [Anaerolineae bacterium]